MIRIAIVEDDESYQKQFLEYLHQYEKEYQEQMEITVFSDGDEIAAGYKSEYDLILLDVEMPFVDGMTAAEEIRKVDQEVVIIFITNMQQYAIRGYAVDALDYVLKPVNYFAFCQRIDRALDRMKKRTAHFITIAVKGGMVKLNTSQLFYVESQGHNLIFHSDRKDYLSSGTMKDVAETLEAIHFYQINKGMLVNLEHVDGFEDGCAVVHGESLPVSRARKNDFLAYLTNYVSEVVK